MHPMGAFIVYEKQNYWYNKYVLNLFKKI